MTSKKEKQHYWSAVAGCMVLFHDLSKEKALVTTDDHRTHVEARLASNPMRDIIYHNEPFDMACGILRSRRRLQKRYMAKYNRLMDSKDPLEAALGLVNCASRAKATGEKLQYPLSASEPGRVGESKRGVAGKAGKASGRSKVVQSTKGAAHKKKGKPKEA